MELIIQVAGIHLLKCCNFEGNPYEVGVSFQCLTLESRKLNHKRAHYTTFLMKFHNKLDSSVKHWNDAIVNNTVYTQNNIL
ncbi:hypothetical protein wScaTNS_09760 [Wolbachia pipientis]